MTNTCRWHIKNRVNGHPLLLVPESSARVQRWIERLTTQSKFNLKANLKELDRSARRQLSKNKIRFLGTGGLAEGAS